MLTDQKLQHFYKQGFIVYPEENEEEFLQRIASAPSHFEKSAILKKVFGIEGVHAEVTYSNSALSIFEAGALFLTHPPQLQLRASFKKKNKYLGIYSKEEILAHELVHYLRAGFQEPLFEEFLAYQTSKSIFRKWTGPILRSSSETLLFFLLFPYFFGRLAYYYATFMKCYTKVGKYTLLLKDEEIQLFAGRSYEHIAEWIENNRHKSLRLRQLYSSLRSATNT